MSIEPSPRLAHNYHEVDFDILWDAYAVAVPRMRAGLAAEIERARATMAEPEPPADGEPAPRA